MFCAVLGQDITTGERLQDQWSSGCFYYSNFKEMQQYSLTAYFIYIELSSVYYSFHFLFKTLIVGTRYIRLNEAVKMSTHNVSLRAKIKTKNCIPLYTPVLLYKSGV